MFRHILLLLSIVNINCNSANLKKDSIEILKIKILDRTFVDYYVNKKSIRDTIVTDFSQIKAIEEQLDVMEKVPKANTRRSFGLYVMILYLKNGDTKIYDIVYTVYDGVVICQEGTEDKYRNNALEHLISNFF